ncbi:MAG: sensor histidine kinase, partial [Chloroflexota bacterium]
QAGFLWIGAFTVVMAGPLIMGWSWQLAGLAMVLLFSSGFFVAGSYGYLIRQAESARRRNQRLLGELQVAHRQLQDYAAQVEEFAAAQERSRLAQELHDSVTQTIFSMNLTVQAARLLVDQNPGGVAGQLDRLQELAHSAAGEIRVLVGRLRPRSVVDEGLAAALRRLAAERQTRDGLQVCLEVSGHKELPEPVTVGLYRIAQEALNNVARHAGTTEVVVRLRLDSCPAYLEVEDHGVGFEPGHMPPLGHFGLAGMAERARELGWRWQLEAQSGRGARIRVEEAAA